MLYDFPSLWQLIHTFDNTILLDSYKELTFWYVPKKRERRLLTFERRC